MAARNLGFPPSKHYLKIPKQDHIYETICGYGSYCPDRDRIIMTGFDAEIDLDVHKQAPQYESGGVIRVWYYVGDTDGF